MPTITLLPQTYIHVHLIRVQIIIVKTQLS